ncbi:hypothetical protein N7517_003772 [Penicillium concentricum]|uniref:Zn(2)-C6 fungal-type domain-containing protein n=1 Tax=Penicillium concentricum TaxID=293559 RepID=A0A9W9S4A4_9EURO|nr:uncharacterized protein N7517_003772 [Penicillium concentricum]KAJ5371766.1 hypothetical protein N7517_003772 [Penicillium concentricum]
MKRAGRSKSRNGCITCKMRHVRCGEEKPDCLQCLKGGRKCDGYNSASQKQLHEKVSRSNLCPAVGPDNRIVLLPGSREERQYVHAFCTQISQAFSGFFSSDLWNYFLPQLSYREPTVRHAVAAVSAMYEQHTNPSADGRGSDLFALQQYNKAIQKFRDHLANPKEFKYDLLLVTCLLFICVEMLRSNNVRVLDHIQGGIHILLNQQKLVSPKRRDGIDHELSQLFYRLNIQLPLFGRPVISFDPQPKKQTSAPRQAIKFENISQARESLTSITNRGLAFSRSAFSHSLSQSPSLERTAPPDQIREQQLKQQWQLEQECYDWYTAFELMMEKPAKKIGLLDPRATLVLKINYNTSLVWLLCCTARHECIYDEYNTYFENIVAAAEEIITLGRNLEKPSGLEPFSLDADVVPMVYWAATKCREPYIRRRAIEVLAKYPTKEGLWGQGRRHCSTARRILEIEEEPLLHLAIGERVPDDSQRVYDALMFPENDVFPNPCPVLLLMKPQGVDGPWARQSEFVGW